VSILDIGINRGNVLFVSIKEVEPIDPAEDDFYSVADSEPTEAVVDTTEQASEEAPAEE
jgi:hypothetical protein